MRVRRAASRSRDMQRMISPAEQPHDKRDHRAQQDASDDGEVEGAVLAFNADVAGKSSEGDGRFGEQGHDHAGRHQDESGEDQHASEGHASIIAGVVFREYSGTRHCRPFARPPMQKGPELSPRPSPYFNPTTPW